MTALLLVLTLLAAEPAMPTPTDWSALTDAAWKERLTPERYQVLRRHGTEPPFCGGYTAFTAQGAGIHHCGGCGLALFASETSFDSGSGWPSFFQPLPGAVATTSDRSHGMIRTEVHCARCGGHLGHVFDDGPRPTGQRYCINAIALDFVAGAAGPATAGQLAEATFAAGCFWGVEAVFAAVPGVVDAESGYAGGHTRAPTYRTVCDGDTGHAEVCRVRYDPARVDFGRLLVVFFENHDPTTRDRQGPDVGSQYRSAIFVHDPAQRRQAEAFVRAIDASGRLGRPIVTQIADAGPYWRAEDYHQDYAAKHGHGACHRPHGVRLGDLLPAP
jgi:peptide methionine sulfoxide reductase msrA/msrB